MNVESVTILRIYTTEGEHQVKNILDFLKEKKIRGVSVFRCSYGSGPSGVSHESHLLDLSLDLPMVIETFDVEEKIQEVMQSLSDKIKPGHMLSWAGVTNVDGKSN